MPLGFRAETPNRWRRAVPDPLRGDWFVVYTLTWPADSQPGTEWPPRLASGAGCLADCARADSAIAFADSVDRGVARGELGLMSGGMPGFQRQPTLEWGWQGSGSQRFLLMAFTTTPATLDSLRNGLRQARVRTP